MIFKVPFIEQNINFV